MLPIETSTLHEQYNAADNSPLPDGVKCVGGTQSLYVFLRLHNLIVERLVLAKKLSNMKEGEAQVSEWAKRREALATTTPIVTPLASQP